MKYLLKVVDFLKGKKTYIASVLVACVVLAVEFGYLDPELGKIVIGLLGASGLAALRAGISKTS